MPGTEGQVAAIAVEKARRLRSRSRSAGPRAFDTRCVARLGALAGPVDKNAPLLSGSPLQFRAFVGWRPDGGIVDA